MATMLSVIVTDAVLPVSQAQTLLSASAGTTFNRIVIDGDMSPNDTVLLLANGASGVTLDSEDDRRQFQDALTAVCRKLAQDIVRDGEGVSKFITLQVSGATDDDSARQIANTIATSPLVKTAFFGQDANWGRIVAAAGRAGVPFDPDKTRLSIAPGEQLAGESLVIFAAGMPTAYAETQAAAIMKQDSITVLLDCGLGEGEAVIWTCDLSHEYVSINADYRT
jgi:glutamate N-acetyltransferase/amino-acid N-acetyltransferase